MPQFPAYHVRTLIAVLLSLVTVAHAEDGGLLPGLISAPLLLPVSIAGTDVMLDSYIVRPDRPGRFPLVIMTHGMPSAGGDAFFRELARRSPVDFNRAALALAQRGYATIAIMRRGYGLSGGDLSERLQRACDYLPAVRNSADDVLAAITALRREPWVEADHILLLGHSTGGLAVLAAAAANPSGVVGVLNFDGGRHSMPTEPCSSDQLISTVAALGRNARVPALWLYAENDRSYGPGLAQEMLMAYIAGRAPARLQLLPPFGTDGHDLITRAPAATWLPAVERFLAELRLPAAPIISLPEPSALSPPPGLLPVCQKVFADYLAYRSDAKAFAINQRGGCGSSEGRTTSEARDNAISICQSRGRDTICQVYAVGQRLVQNE
jgi:dienelactone hydrolase